MQPEDASACPKATINSSVEVSSPAFSQKLLDEVIFDPAAWKVNAREKTALANVSIPIADFPAVASGATYANVKPGAEISTAVATIAEVLHMRTNADERDMMRINLLYKGRLLVKKVFGLHTTICRIVRTFRVSVCQGSLL